jgi:hypothetical protein
MSEKRISWNAHRSGGACLNGNEDGLGAEEAGVQPVETEEGSAYALGEGRGEPLVEWGRGESGEVRGRGQGGGGFALAEIGEPLGWSPQPAGLLPAEVLEILLVVHHGEGVEGRGRGRGGEVGGREVGEGELDDDGGVAVGGVAPGRRHAVDNQMLRAGGGGDDEAARTHAEGVDPSAFYLHGKAVFSGGKLAAGAVVTEAVDEGLGVLEAKSDGDGFRLEGDAEGVQVTVDVAGGVSGS